MKRCRDYSELGARGGRGQTFIQAGSRETWAFIRKKIYMPPFLVKLIQIQLQMFQKHIHSMLSKTSMRCTMRRYISKPISISLFYEIKYFSKLQHQKEKKEQFRLKSTSSILSDVKRRSFSSEACKVCSIAFSFSPFLLGSNAESASQYPRERCIQEHSTKLSAREEEELV